jgi:cholesterol oxidase
VWLLDFRVSTALLASLMKSTADDVANFDYPAAIAKVKKETGAETVQMVVHCYGSTTFFMSMLAGLKGVRSIVCSQISNDVIAVPVTLTKPALHLPLPSYHHKRLAWSTSSNDARWAYVLTSSASETTE